ncbi:MAG: zinc-binding dehydrogenase, partial [Acidobacteriota bacterium]|nr:zinc-binding dehydrogenase [Acidobacteriota bacterium]
RLQDLVGAVRLLAENKLKPLVTHPYPLEEINRAMADLRGGRVLGRAVLLTPAGREAMGQTPTPSSGS